MNGLPRELAHAARKSLTLACLVAMLPLAGCCNYFYYDCAPQQPAGITANENVSAFATARDQAEGLLAKAGEMLTPAALARVQPQYDAAATAANAWIDQASVALRSGSYAGLQGARRLDDVVANVSLFADGVASAASDPANLRAPYTPLPADAVIDALTAAPPIVAAAEQVKSGVGTGADAIRSASGAILSLDPATRGLIADAVQSSKWSNSAEVLAPVAGAAGS